MSAQEWITVRVCGREDLCDDIVGLEFESVDGGSLPAFAPGSHVDIEVRPGLVRQYSLYDPLSEDGKYRVAVLKDAASRGGSALIHQEFRLGHQTRISPPKNAFALVPSSGKVLLFAGGIGITPILSMCAQLHRQGRDFFLFYCARRKTRTAFLSHLAQGAYADKVGFYFDEEAQPNPLDFAAVLGAPGAGGHAYACGPGGFLDAFLETARRLGWADESLHVERFAANVETDGDAFTVVAVESGVTVEVKEDETILQALEAAGVDIPFACEQGICGTCITPVLDGQPDHRDMFLSDEEKAGNKLVAPCCSRSKTAVLKLAV